MKRISIKKTKKVTLQPAKVIKAPKMKMTKTEPIKKIKKDTKTLYKY